MIKPGAQEKKGKTAKQALQQGSEEILKKTAARVGTEEE